MPVTSAGQMLWVVIAGLDPAIHRFSHFSFLMDARVKPAHDEPKMLVGMDKGPSTWIP
jgi:hypothetical protein